MDDEYYIFLGFKNWWPTEDWISEIKNTQSLSITHEIFMTKIVSEQRHIFVFHNLVKDKKKNEINEVCKVCRGIYHESVTSYKGPFTLKDVIQSKSQKKKIIINKINLQFKKMSTRKVLYTQP